MRWLKGKTTRTSSDPIVIVSGLPRSGTSLMMKMLEAGGVPPLTDGLREADSDNPRGYYEFEQAKRLSSGDSAWLDEAPGKAVKIIATLLYDLPDRHEYRVIFMRRRMAEILASQRQMLINRGEDPDAVPDATMARIFEGHLDRLRSWLTTAGGISVLEVDYNDLMDEGPEVPASRIDEFLGGKLDTAAMCAVVEPGLYRQRHATR